MHLTLPRYGRWLPCYRLAAWWIATALLCTLVIGVAVRVSDALGLLAIILLGVLTLGWFLFLVVSSLWTAWGRRNDLPMLGACLLTPFVAAAIYALVLAGVWGIWGARPLPLDKTDDFQIDQILPSPDGAWQAIHDEDLSGGPMTGTSQDVYLMRQRPRSALFFKDRVFSEECVQDLQMRWLAPRTLQISYVVGDKHTSVGLIPRESLPLIHSREDEWRFSDPVRLVETPRIVHGNLC